MSNQLITETHTEPIKYFKALADETRIRILTILEQYELNVNELTSILEMGQSRISRHLKILSDSGMLRFRRQGLWVFYSLNTVGEAAELLNRIAFILKGHPHYEVDRDKTRSLVEERTRSTVQFFDTVAGDWAQMKRHILGEFDLLQRIIERLDEGTVTADLGCGNGDLTARIARSGGHVIGVDRSTKMLETARRNFSQAGLDVELRIGELEHLPLREKEVDNVIMNMVLHHLASPFTCIQEAGRILKPHGKLILADLLSHDREELRSVHHDRWLGFSRSELIEWLHKANFRLTHEEQVSLKSGLDLILIEGRYGRRKEQSR